jgi:hypothetical protein
MRTERTARRIEAVRAHYLMLEEEAEELISCGCLGAMDVFFTAEDTARGLVVTECDARNNVLSTITIH